MKRERRRKEHEARLAYWKAENVLALERRRLEEEREMLQVEAERLRAADLNLSIPEFRLLQCSHHNLLTLLRQRARDLQTLHAQETADRPQVRTRHGLATLMLLSAIAFTPRCR